MEFILHGFREYSLTLTEFPRNSLPNRAKLDAICLSLGSEHSRHQAICLDPISRTNRIGMRFWMQQNGTELDEWAWHFRDRAIWCTLFGIPYPLLISFHLPRSLDPWWLVAGALAFGRPRREVKKRPSWGSLFKRFVAIWTCSPTRPGKSTLLSERYTKMMVELYRVDIEGVNLLVDYSG